MKRKINLYLSLVGVLACVLTFCAVLAVSYHTGRTRMEIETERQAALVAAGLEEIHGVTEAKRQEYLEAVGKSDRSRVTVIKPDGTVYFDSNHSPDRMENHLARPEVQEALHGGTGRSTRTSATLGEQTYYTATLLSTGEILRLSNTTGLVASDLQRSAPLLVLIIMGVIALSARLARWLTERLVAPLRKLSLHQPPETFGYEELSPLLVRLREQQGQIAQQMAQLRSHQIEFDSITNNMSEGLVVLDAGLCILSANHAALRLLGARMRDWTGENLIALSRDAALLRKAQAAAGGKKTTFSYTRRADTQVQIYCSPVEADGVPRGCVLLMLDVSERHAAERSRREFTANVSHELKTPLTTISGFAEIIALGMAKPEDISGFAEKIQAEAAHLIGLVDDIIQLSRLDEGLPSALAFEQVELTAVCKEVLERLRPRADAREITLGLTGERAFVRGVPHMLGEAVFNLCDNAIKYGKTGGTVAVSVEDCAEGVQLTVKDDGCGIAPADRARIFERFYRADKSHSRTVEGTGLGLAIVKHIGELHGGTVRVQSAPGAGSAFILTLPRA